MKKKVEIVFVLDRSGSMSQIRKSAINGFNTFVSQQREVNPEAKMSLIQFDHEYKVSYEGLALAHVKDLSTDTFVPRGMTALNDAMGRTLLSVRDRLETEENTKVIFVTLTDGYENASKEFSKENIKALTKELEENYQCEIIYIGANQDAIKESAGFGIKSSKAITFDNSDKGVSEVFHSLSKNLMACMESADSFEFNDKDRKKQDNLLKTIIK